MFLRVNGSERLLGLTLLPSLSPNFRRSATSLESESDSNSCRSRSHSDELLQSMGSSPSTESFIMEGEEKTHFHLFVFLLAFAKRIFSEGNKIEAFFFSFSMKSVSGYLFGTGSTF